MTALPTDVTALPTDVTALPTDVTAMTTDVPTRKDLAGNAHRRRLRWRS